MIETVLQSLYEKDGPIHLQTVRDIVSALHDVQVKLERELLITRANKIIILPPKQKKRRPKNGFISASVGPVRVIKLMLQFS